MGSLGIHFIGLTSENGRKFLSTLIFLALVVFGTSILRSLSERILKGKKLERYRFWTSQGIRILTAVVLIVGILSIWFDDPSRLAAAAGLLTAGIAFALQRVITAVAAYFVLLRGKTFRVGDRISMTGVRGDVIALDFIQITIMEMGQPPESADAPSVWVNERQYTGRIATVTNDKIFDQPVYNYSRQLPFLWEEMQIPVPYSDNRKRAEEILLEVAVKHTTDIQSISEEKLRDFEERYAMRRSDLHPRVYWRLTEKWVELSVRFIVGEHEVRELKDRMSRDILMHFEEAGIGIASPAKKGYTPSTA